MPLTHVIGSAVTAPVTPIKGRQPLARVAPNTDKALRVAADAYIANPLTALQDHGLALYGTTRQTLNVQAGISGTGSGHAVTDYGNPLTAGLKQARNTAITSTIRNGFLLVRKKEDLPTAVGNVTADVVTNAGRGVVGSLATNGAVFAIAKAGGGSFPVIVGGIAAGMVASYATGHVLKKTGARQAIAVKTTQAVRKAMGRSKP